MRKVYIVVVEYATRKLTMVSKRLFVFMLIAEVGARIIEHCKDVLLNPDGVVVSLCVITSSGFGVKYAREAVNRIHLASKAITSLVAQDMAYICIYYCLHVQ